MVVPCLVNSLNIFTYYGGFNQHSLWYRKLDYQQYIWALFFHSILLIFEKWNKSVLSVWIFYSPGFFFTAFIVTICHGIREFFCQRCSEVETPVLNVNVGREAEIVGKVMQGQITELVLIFQFKFSNKNIETLSENSSKVTKKIPEWHCYCYTVFYSFTPCFCVFIADFDQVNTNWERPARHLYIYIYKTNFRSFWKEEKYS